MKTLLVAVLLSVTASAQQPAQPWDATSYATAAVTPTAAVVDAWRSSSRGCRLGRLALSEGLGNGVTLWAKRSYSSPRPCLGCAADGMPSGHTMNSVIGARSAWGGGWRGLLLSAAAVAATGWLRHEARAHTWRQITAGAALGIGAEAAGLLIRCDASSHD